LKHYNVNQTSFLRIPWNKIYIYIFQETLFIGINLVNLKQTHPKSIKFHASRKSRKLMGCN